MKPPTALTAALRLAGLRRRAPPFELARRPVAGHAQLHGGAGRAGQGGLREAAARRAMAPTSTTARSRRRSGATTSGRSGAPSRSTRCSRDEPHHAAGARPARSATRCTRSCWPISRRKTASRRARASCRPTPRRCQGAAAGGRRRPSGGLATGCAIPPPPPRANPLRQAHARHRGHADQPRPTASG